MDSLQAKREQFRKYLERCGVIDALSKALIKLYEEQNKPDDAIRFVRKFMCESCPDDAQYDILKADFDESKKTVQKLEQDVERLKSRIVLTPEEIAAELEKAMTALKEDLSCDTMLLKKYLTQEILNQLKAIITPSRGNLIDCCQSGFDNHDSEIGVFATDVEAFDLYKDLFHPIILEHHKLMDNTAEQIQPNLDFGNVEEVKNMDPEQKYIESTKIRIGRNFEGYPFFPKLTEQQFIDTEKLIKDATECLAGDLVGSYVTMDSLDQDTQMAMVKRNVLFKRGDKYLTSAGCYRFWPTGRGIFSNPEETFIVWANQKDHLRIISMAKCGDLGDVYSRIVSGVRELEKTLKFQTRHARYGNLSASPSNIGTSMRVSVQIRLPNLAKNKDRIKELSEKYKIKISGTEGEKTPNEDGLMEVSNSQILGVNEIQTVKAFQTAILEMIRIEEEEEEGDEDE